MATASSDISVPGGIKVFFTETGGVERDLGNIVGDSVSITRDTEELEHFTNRSGKRRKDKVITVEESAQIDFELDEVNVDNLRYFFKGGVISTSGAGSDTIIDQKEVLPGEGFVSVEKPGLSAVSVRQFLDQVFLFDGAAFLDHSVEADTAAGVPFAINADADDVLYCGKQTQFQEVGIDVAVASVGYTAPLWEYWNGAVWSPLTVVGTGNFSIDEVLTFTPPVDWAQTTVNGATAYYVRFSQSAAAPTAATVNALGRQSLVEHIDYDVNPGAASTSTSTSDGSVRRIAGGSLVDGEEVKVSFTYVTFTAQTFGIAEVSTLEGSARFQSFPGTGRGRKWSMTVPKCQLINNGAMDLDDTDFQTIPLSLVVLDNFDVDPINPFGTVTMLPL